MTNDEILTKVIERAVKNGWPKPGNELELVKIGISKLSFEQARLKLTSDYFPGDGIAIQTVDENGFYTDMYFGSDLLLIFDHDFARAFWGDERTCSNCGMTNRIVCDCRYASIFPNWQYHLRQMVLWKEPATYLEQFLNDK